MFLDFYTLREQPFGVTPDPRFLYFGSGHREALASLLYSIETKRGFSALVAEPGMGKTSLLFQMLESLHKSARTAFLFQTEGDSSELMRSLLRDLGVNVTSHDPVAMHDALNDSLLQELRAGRQVVVVIDEAQNLDEKVLETVRLLSNFETSTQKLMHIVLAGQPGLATKLSEVGMTQLRQRVSNIIRLRPFRREETIEYIGHRLHTAGYQGPGIFTPDALEMIARLSQGIPRNINSLCFQALSIGFATQSKRIGPEIMREVVSDLDFAPRRSDRPTVQEPVPWPPLGLQPPEFIDSSGPTNWETVASVPPRSSGIKWLAGIACFAILPISIIALSDSKIGLSETLPGRASTQMVNAVLSSVDSNADFQPAWPAKLNPPLPPPTAEAPANSSATSSPDDQTSPPLQDGKNNEMIEATKGAQSTTSTGAARVPGRGAATEKDRTFAYSRSETAQSPIVHYIVPTKVQVLRSETVFQFALELYGQSNWNIIQAICAVNPQIHDPYSVLSTGQWIQLPSDLETVTAKYNSRETIGRLR